MVVTKLDRLGRSTRELLDLIERIGKAGASFRSLGDPLWDTGSSQGRLLSTMLAAIAEFERELIRERTGEGRKRAMAAGVKFGRKPKLSDFQRQEAIKRRAAGETLASIAKSYRGRYLDDLAPGSVKISKPSGQRRTDPALAATDRSACDPNCDKTASCVPGRATPRPPPMKRSAMGDVVSLSNAPIDLNTDTDTGSSSTARAPGKDCSPTRSCRKNTS